MRMTNKEITALRALIADLSRSGIPLLDDEVAKTNAALDRLAELERLAERVEYKSEPGHCSIKVSGSDEWGGNGKVEHVWQDGDLS